MAQSRRALLIVADADGNTAEDTPAVLPCASQTLVLLSARIGIYLPTDSRKGQKAMEMTASGHGVAGRKRSEVRQRTEVVALRLLPGERVQLETAAQDLQVSLSELIRSSALEAARTRGLRIA